MGYICMYVVCVESKRETGVGRAGKTIVIVCSLTFYTSTESDLIID